MALQATNYLRSKFKNDLFLYHFNEFELFNGQTFILLHLTIYIMSHHLKFLNNVTMYTPLNMSNLILPIE
jgi:hypothetical protein